MEIIWQQHTLPLPDVQLAWYEAGSGPTLLFLHGGGQDNRSLRSLAAPFAEQNRCVLFDMRGSGNSRLRVANHDTLDVANFAADIEALRTELGEDKLRLVGHSFGGSQALLYAMRYPERVARMALLAPGALNEELLAAGDTNVLKALSGAEREELKALSAQRKAAFQRGDDAAVVDVRARMLRLLMRGWFYAPLAAEQFVQFCLAVGEPLDSRLWEYVYPSWRAINWAALSAVDAPTLIIYGYQDAAPPVQAYMIKDWLPQSQIVMLNQCGHWAWLEQPEQCYAPLLKFLAPAT